MKHDTCSNQDSDHEDDNESEKDLIAFRDVKETL